MKKKAQKYISKLHKEKYPKNLLILDTETNINDYKDHQIHTFKLGWSCLIKNADKKDKIKKVWQYHHHKTSFLRYLENCCHVCNKLLIIAHNIYYDLQASGFFRYFAHQGWKLDFIYDKGLTYILSIKHNRKKVTFVSSTNFFPFSAKRLGELLGKEKLKIDFENDDDKTIAIYCKRDTEIIVDAMLGYIDFLKIHNCGSFSLTRASQSFTSYRFTYMDKKIYIHQDEIVRELEENSYFGGRTETFYIGKLPLDDYVSLDINSMYPYVMQKYSFPTHMVDYIEEPKKTDYNFFVMKYRVCAEVEIETDEPAYCVRRNEKLVFPVGHFVTNVCTAGLVYAMHRKHLIKINAISLYEHDNLFDNYVDYFYKLKAHYGKSGNKVYYNIVKIFLNSLYGKFGQKRDILLETKEVDQADYSKYEVVDLDTNEQYTIVKLLNTSLKYQGREATKVTLTAIPAHITEYARFELYKLMCAVGLENVIYVDTDSLKIRKKHIQPLYKYIDDQKLGFLKIEEEFKQFQIDGLKSYKTEFVHKHKGVPAKAKEITHNKYQYLSFQGQSTHLRKNINDGFFVRKIIKTLSGKYDKGDVLPDGIVKPFIIKTEK